MVEALEGKYGGRLLAVSSEKGEIIGRTDLGSPPVFDGMAAVSGRLYVSTLDGRVVSLSGRD
jgi:hypothetical protein